jgi:hypothetical protein
MKAELQKDSTNVQNSVSMTETIKFNSGFNWVQPAPPHLEVDPRSSDVHGGGIHHDVVAQVETESKI